MARFATALGLVLALCALALAGDWGASNWKDNPTGWEGFGVGTSVKYRQTVKMEIPNLPPGTELPGQEPTEERHVLAEITATEYVVKIESAVMGQTVTAETRIPRRPTGEAEALPTRVEELGAGTVAVGGTDYPCTKKRVTTTLADGTQHAMILWENPQHGVLKMESAEGQAAMDWTVLRLDAPQRVGDRTLACREVRMTSGPAGVDADTRMWMSLEVPGRIVRMEMHTNQGGMKTSMVRELVALEAK
jgi:hypothetical protein